MTTISRIDLAAISGGNAIGNGQTGDRYRVDPNDPGTGGRPWSGGLPGRVLGGTLGPAAGGGGLGGASPFKLVGQLR